MTCCSFSNLFLYLEDSHILDPPSEIDLYALHCDLYARTVHNHSPLKMFFEGVLTQVIQEHNNMPDPTYGVDDDGPTSVDYADDTSCHTVPISSEQVEELESIDPTQDDGQHFITPYIARFFWGGGKGTFGPL